MVQIIELTGLASCLLICAEILDCEAFTWSIILTIFGIVNIANISIIFLQVLTYLITELNGLFLVLIMLPRSYTKSIRILVF